MLDEVGITVNKNAIPFDTKSPFVTSGIRSVLLPQLQEVLKKKIWSKSVNLSL